MSKKKDTPLDVGGPRPPLKNLSQGPETWRNSNVACYVVQAMPATAQQPGEPRPPAFREQPCSAVKRAAHPRLDPCTGLSEHAMSGVYLDRIDALHAIRQHYVYANWSLCRFTSHLHGDYTADLVFEIDAHVKGLPNWQLDHQFYTPIVRAAVTVGRRLLDYLLATLKIDARYITTCVTRMGARVTVDWRAFGPQRLWTLLAVVRWVEAQVLGPNELDQLASELHAEVLTQVERLGHNQAEDFGVADTSKVTCIVNVDGSIYTRSDLPRMDREHGGNRFKGPFIRPVGSLHSGSSSLNMFCRATPVPHETFTPNNADWLSRGSRAESFVPAHGPSIHDHADPSLFYDLWKWPEARDPRGDRLIESDPCPCQPLVELFHRADDLQDELSDDAQDEISSVRRKALGSGLKPLGSAQAEITSADAEKILARLKEAQYQKGDRIRAICPVCNKTPKSLTVYKRDGHAYCFRCHLVFSLADLAGKLGLEGVVGWKRQSSSTIQRVPVESLPPEGPVTRWGEKTIVLAPDFDTIEEARDDQRRVLDNYLTNRDTWDLLVLRGPTGLGKTTGAIDAIGRHGLVSRGLFARSESRAPYLKVLQPSRAIDGRRPDNCESYNMIAQARDRLIPEWTVCGACEHRQDCPYLAQFQDLEGVHLGLLHAHAGHLHRRLFDNGAEITLIDENPWDRSLELIDLDARELDLFRCEPDVVADEETGTVGLEYPIVWKAPTEALGRLVDALLMFLRSDAVLSGEDAASDVSEAAKHGEWTKNGCVADRDLARLLFESRSDLAQAVQDIREADYETVEANSAWLAGLEGRSRKPPKRILRALCGALQLAWLSHVTDRPRTLPIVIHRQNNSTNWSLRLTRRHPIEAGQTILLSSTIRPEQVRLASGERRVVVYAPTVRQRERRIIVADKSFSLTSLVGKSKHERRTRLFETVKKLVESEYVRTGLPVAVIGRSKLINLWNRFMFGDKVKPFAMPWGPATREEQAKALRALTIPLGYISGYAGGVAGSNAFAVETEDTMRAGGPRFVRALVILGNLVPPLGQVASELRGVYAGEEEVYPVEYPGIGTMWPARDVVVDWTPTYRTVPLQEPEVGTVIAAKNVPGFVDPRANELLHASYEAEFIQIAGRMRGSIPDPIDPTITPVLWVVAGTALGSQFPFDEVLGLEDLRERLGLAVTERDAEATNPRHRPSGSSKRSLEDQVFTRWKKSGPKATIAWLVTGLRWRGTPWAKAGPLLLQEVRGLVEKSGIGWRPSYDDHCVEAIRELNTETGPRVPR